MDKISKILCYLLNLNINKLSNIKRGLYYKRYWNKKNKQLEKEQQNEI